MPCRPHRPCSMLAAVDTIRRFSSTIRIGSSRAWAAEAQASTRRRRTSTTNGRYASTSSCTEDVPDVLRGLQESGIKIGLISNTQRCLSSFQIHFDLEGLFDVTISSADHGFMKPHPSIFQAALGLAGASSDESVMVGDSLAHDIEGARRLGIRAVLVSRSGPRPDCPPDIPVIHTLRELPGLL